MLIPYFDFIPCCLPEVAHRMMIRYSLGYLKVIEWPTKDSPLLIEGGYTYDLFSRSLLRNL